jgi:Tfp pilus assembly protein PilF
MMQGDLGSAVKTLRQLVIVAPDLAAIHVQLASAYFGQNNFEQARHEISWLAQRTPDTSRDQAAGARLEAAASVISDPAQFGLRSAEFQTSLGQFDMARSALEKVDADAAARINAQLMLARLELRAGDVQSASKRSAALSDRAPEDPSISQLRAEVLTVQRRFVEAADVLKRLVPAARDGNLAISLYQVRRLGGIENAMQPLEDWLASHPRDARVREAYAEALRAAGDNRRAIHEYESLLVESPNDAAILNNLGWFYYLEGDTRALATARKAHGIAPQVVAVADTYGWLLVESGAIDEGLAQLRPLDAVTGVTRPDIRLHFAAALARKGEGARAKELVAELMAEQPEFQYPNESKRLLADLQDGVT